MSAGSKHGILMGDVGLLEEEDAEELPWEDLDFLLVLWPSSGDGLGPRFSFLGK